MVCTGSNHGRRGTDAVCLPDLLREQVRARPGAVAVRDGETVVSYADFASRADRVAGLVAAAGVGPDQPVGLFVEPSVDSVVAVWGVLLAGAAYVPLSPDYPEERLRFMVADARLPLVVTDRALLSRLSRFVPGGTRVVCLDDATGSVSTGVEVGPDNLAYVIYTSGSTGRPKGVLVEQRGVVSQLRWLRDAHDIGPGAVVLQKTPLSFDAAQWEVLSLAVGATVVAGSPGLHRDPDRLIATVRSAGATAVQCVPTLLRALLDTERMAECTSLRQVFSGGEVLSQSLARRCLDAVPWCRLVNLYGPTECTINSSAFTVDAATLVPGRESVPIGKPVAGTHYRILDHNGDPVGPGETGELHIGGVQVARGYLDRPELTARRFAADPLYGRVFRTGDLARWNADGTAQFVGRVDNQVKLRGFRVELDEIRLAIEAHAWVRAAAVVVKDDERTGFQNLVACVELDPREAALMDQGRHSAHHQSKQSRVQVRAQLSDPGVRTDLGDRPTVVLPGREPSERQRREVFARKTYRFYEGGAVTSAELLAVLGRRAEQPSESGVVDVPVLGAVLRYFGQFRSGERLLPKYGYASPGSLYATQLYLTLVGVPGMRAGTYYYHPADHRLVLLTALPGVEPAARVHFVGRRRAIEPVYQDNIEEVLEIEVGHMVGLFEEVLPRYGLDIRPVGPRTPALAAEPGDHHIGTFEIGPWLPRPGDHIDLYLQTHPGHVSDLPTGQYRYTGHGLEWVSGELVRRNHVIAINQRVYQRASVGVTVVARNPEPWLRFVDLGRTLHRLSANDTGIGFMSAGYSSRSGHDLPSATRIDAVLAACGLPTGPSYFAVGGKVSADQRAGEGMREDAVHMKGPAELIRDDLAEQLPDYMIPNKVVVFDALPVTANGKVDQFALLASDRTDIAAARPLIPPRTDTERRVAAVWAAALRREAVSVSDDFFTVGGNSLVAVALINRLNAEFDSALPVQALFEAPTVAQLAKRIATAAESTSRLIPLWTDGGGPRVFCWPGLGGYPMNLRLLAAAVGRPFHGVQARGINSGETAHATIAAAAAEDIAEIRRDHPHGPYALWGYSFGARVAVEAAHQLAGAGERVSELVLIAPGAPTVTIDGHPVTARTAAYTDRAYIALLYSVFAGRLHGPDLAECVRTVHNDDTFAQFVAHRFDLTPDTVRRIATVVHRTFTAGYQIPELACRRLTTPITILKANGDDYSSLEATTDYATQPPQVITLPIDHYALLTHPGVDTVAAHLRPSP